MAQFSKGISGNPSGRPKGRQNKITPLRQMLEPHGAELVMQLVDLAKGGEMAAMRLIIERLLPPARENPINIELPEVTCISACSDAQAKILAAVANGEILLSEGDTLSSLVENRRKALETSEIEARIAALEERKS